MHKAEKQKASNCNSESGNIFFTLFGAVVIVGLLGTIIMSTMRGPLTTMVEVQTRTKAEIEMDIASKLVLLEATQLPGDGDCDADGFVEPLEYLDAGGAGPTGGGFLPTVVSSSRIDPWGIEFGYCGWDAGAVTNSIACDTDSNGTNERLDGNGDPSDETYTVISIISAGPDQIFQTSCSGGASPSVTKGGDDIVVRFSYGAAIAATNGLWNIKSGDPSIAEIDKNLEVTGGAAFTGGIDLTSSSAALRLGAASMLFPDQTTLSTCNAANNGLVRVNTTPNPDVLELCDSVNGWVSISNGFWSGGSGNDIYYNTGTPQVGIGTTTPSSTLEVSGDVSISDVLNVANGFNLTGGNATVSNNFNVTGITTLTGTTNAGVLNATGAVDFDTTLNVDGSTTMGGALDAQDEIANSTGDLNLADSVDVTGGDLTVDDNLIIIGSSDLQNTIINTTGDVTLDDTAVITGTLDAQGAISDSTGNLTLSDDVDISSDLDVTGDIDGTNISASGAVNAGTTVNVNGDQLGPPLTCTSAQKLEWNPGSGWSCVTDLQGGSGGGIPALDDVSDVAAPTPANGDCIVYNNVSGNWESAACAGIAAGVFEITSNVARIKSSAGTYASDDFVFGSPQTADDTDTNHDARFFFDKSKGAFRAGNVDSTQWDDVNVGTSSIAFGANALASGANGNAIGNSTNAIGDYSTSLGWLTMASGAGSTAIGNAVLAGDGAAGSGAGDQSLAIGLGSPAGNFPRVTGTQGLGIFMGDQTDVVMSASNTMGIFGGTVIIDPNMPATELSASTAGAQTLELDVTGDIGANNYCDANGNNCFTAAGVSGGIWTDNTTYISRQNFNVINTGQTSTTAGLDGDGTRALYDPNKAALRGGTISGGNTAWQDINIGDNSLGWGQNTLASGPGSIALGYEVSATGDYAIALGGSGTSAVANSAIAIGSDLGAVSTGSIAIGHGNIVSSGTNGMALGTNARTSGNYAASIGLGTAAGAFPIVSGANSLGIFMGDQSGYDLSDSNFMALVGGDFLIDDDGTAGSQGCIRYTEGTGLEFSNDCGSFTPFFAGVTANSLDWNAFADAMTLDANTMINMDTNGVDLSFDSNTLAIDSSANTVGVGIAVPEANLHVSYAGGVQDTDPATFTLQNETVQGSAIIQFREDDPWGFDIENWSSSDGSQNELRFEGFVSGSQSGNRVVIDRNTAHLGVLTSPVTALDVAGTAKIADGGEGCAPGIAGALRYNTGTIDYCNGAAWSSLGNDLDWDNLLNAMTLDASTTIDMDTNAADLNFDSDTLVIDSDVNRIGIGTASPSVSLDLASETDAIHIPTGTEAQRPAAVDGMIRYKTDVGSSAIGFEVREAGAWVAMGASVSDKRLKDNIQPLNGKEILNRLQNIKTYSYTMKNDATHRPQYGVIAQELRDTFPELVHGAPDDEDNMMSVKYVGLIAPMIEATKELKNENNQLRAELDALKQQVQTLNRHALNSTDKASISPYFLFALLMFGSVALYAALRKRRY